QRGIGRRSVHVHPVHQRTLWIDRREKFQQMGPNGVAHAFGSKPLVIDYLALDSYGLVPGLRSRSVTGGHNELLDSTDAIPVLTLSGNPLFSGRDILDEKGRSAAVVARCQR